MKFSGVEPDVNFDVCRFLSESGTWEVGVRRVIFGFRVCANPVGNGAYTVDYCCGPDEVSLLVTLAQVMEVLSALPETLTDAQARQLFPTYTLRPMTNDPDCEAALSALTLRATQGHDLLCPSTPSLTTPTPPTPKTQEVNHA